MRILRFNWLIGLYLLMSLLRIASFLIVKHSCVREELIDLPSFLQTQLQKITVKEHLFGKFALAPLTFGPCSSPTDTFPFTYHFPYVSISICQSINCIPICAVDNLKQLQRQIDILDNPRQRMGSHFRLPYTLQSSGDFLWCRETEAHIPLLLVSSLPV